MCLIVYNFASKFNIIDTLLIAFFIAWIIIAYKYSDWKNWRTYYPTIIFWGLGDMIYNVIFCDTPLWKYADPWFGHILSDILTMVIIFPCAALLYLTHFPKTVYKKIAYIFFWVFTFTGIEFIFTKLGSIIYFNSWTIIWSAVHNTYQFFLLRLHHHNPLLAWAAAFLILAVIMSIFKIPFSILTK
ncbi:hypothetical protein HMPREF1982_04381 [Clostridiales bacterium oral taxon 876 str. F0540]|nr:hypothetical protein HMPREF1982_04381 [Clostridiales bacterium oral taxon 876 str. F0540]